MRISVKLRVKCIAVIKNTAAFAFKIFKELLQSGRLNLIKWRSAGNYDSFLFHLANTFSITVSYTF